MQPWMPVWDTDYRDIQASPAMLWRNGKPDQPQHPGSHVYRQAMTCSVSPAMQPANRGFTV